MTRLKKRKKITLSVLIPVYNEEQTVERLIKKILKQKEIFEVIIIDDGSTDSTPHILRKLTKRRQILFLQQKHQGKGAAIRNGLSHTNGSHILIQDADLEYDPADIPVLLQPIQQQKAEVVFGSRFLGPHSNLLFWHRVGNSLLNFLINILYNTTLSDMETCYKLLPTATAKKLHLKSNQFTIEPEITCKLLKQSIRIFEVPISYVGRDFSQGKKMNWRHVGSAVATILNLRFSDLVYNKTVQ